MSDWLFDLIWRYPQTTRYLLFMALLTVVVYLIDGMN